MIEHVSTEYKELPIGQLIGDPHQPREDFNTEGDKNRLKLSLEEFGIQQPIAVMKLENGSYQIIDGHRRHKCATEIGLTQVPCLIYPKLEGGQLERIRFEWQTNRRLWKPLERAEALANFKKASGIQTNKEAAEKLFISETLISNSLKLGKLRSDHQKMMDDHKLGPSYQVEFVKLFEKLRPIKNFTVDDIIKTLFERVQHKVIRSSKDFRTLGRIFLRATANHGYIYAFLSNPDMTVEELEQDTIQSGFSLWLEQSIKKIKSNEKAGMPFSSQEKVLLLELQKLMNKHLT